MYVKAKNGDTNKEAKYEAVCWSVSHSNLTVCCAGVPTFRFPIVGVLGLRAITTSTTHCTVHHHRHERGMAWQRGQYHVNGTDTVGRWVGGCVGVHVPVDYASVGLTCASWWCTRPSTFSCNSPSGPQKLEQLIITQVCDLCQMLVAALSTLIISLFYQGNHFSCR